MANNDATAVMAIVEPALVTAGIPLLGWEVLTTTNQIKVDAGWPENDNTFEIRTLLNGSSSDADLAGLIIETLVYYFFPPEQ